jgi:hypothetical protein
MIGGAMGKGEDTRLASKPGHFSVETSHNEYTEADDTTTSDS